MYIQFLRGCKLRKGRKEMSRVIWSSSTTHQLALVMTLRLERKSHEPDSGDKTTRVASDTSDLFRQDKW